MSLRRWNLTNLFGCRAGVFDADQALLHPAREDCHAPRSVAIQDAASMMDRAMRVRRGCLAGWTSASPSRCE